MINRVLISIGLITVYWLGFGSAQISCVGRPDGSYGHGCLSYTRCQGGVGTIIDCPSPGWAFDVRTGECEPWTTVPPPCGSIDNNCTGYADGRYAILPDCRYFYTCQGQIFFGANPCNFIPDEGDLRFDEDEQACNWVWATPPPCGTGPPRPPVTTELPLN